MTRFRFVSAVALLLAAGCGDSQAPTSSTASSAPKTVPVGAARSEGLPVAAIQSPTERTDGGQRPAAAVPVPQEAPQPAGQKSETLEFQGDLVGKMTLAEFRTKYSKTADGIEFPVMPGDSYPGIASYSMPWHEEAGLVVGIPSYRARPEQWTVAGAPTMSVTYDFLDGVLQGITIFVKDKDVRKVAAEFEQKYGKPDVVDASHVRKWTGPSWMIVVEPDGSISLLDSALSQTLSARRQAIRP